MKKDKPKTYRIDSLDKLCNVANSENVLRLSEDFITWLFYYTKTIDNYRNQYPKQTKGKSNIQIAKSAFDWIDDGKNDWLGTKVINSETGEIHEYPAEELKK